VSDTKHMTYTCFIQQLQEQTSALSYEKGLAMAILLSRKLSTNYQAFSDRHGWGDPRVLEEALQCCEAAQTGEVSREKIDPLFERLYAVTPDTEDFGDYDGSYALNAAAAILHALQYLSGKDPKDIYAIGILYTDTTDAKLHEMGIEEEGDIENHLVMQEAWQLVLRISMSFKTAAALIDFAF
jgi:uncharacterized protein YjaG (DUF416 family)